jgi:hypothetical protein
MVHSLKYKKRPEHTCALQQSRIAARKQSKRLPRILHEVALGRTAKTLALMVQQRAILPIGLYADWTPVFDLRLQCELP